MTRAHSFSVSTISRDNVSICNKSSVIWWCDLYSVLHAPSPRFPRYGKRGFNHHNHEHIFFQKKPVPSSRKKNPSPHTNKPNPFPLKGKATAVAATSSTRNAIFLSAAAAESFTLGHPQQPLPLPFFLLRLFFRALRCRLAQLPASTRHSHFHNSMAVLPHVSAAFRFFSYSLRDISSFFFTLLL